MNKPVYFKVLFMTSLSCLLFLSGCWNSKELDNLGVVVAMGIDRNEEGMYSLTTQVLNPSEIATDAPTSRTPVSIYKTTGESLFEAFRSMTEKAPRKMYLSQLRLLVIGTELAEEGILPSLDIFYRDHEFRTAFFVAIAKNTDVEELLDVLTPYEKIPANKIMKSIEDVQSYHGDSRGMAIDELIGQILSKGQNPVLTGLVVEGDPAFGTAMNNVERMDALTQLRVDGLAVLKQDKLVGWLDADASKGLNYITGEMKSTTVTFPCDDGLGSVEVLRTDSRPEVKFKDGQPSVSVELELEGNVTEMDCSVDLSNPDVIQDINSKVEEKVKQQMETAVKAAQEEFGSDIFGFGSLLHRKNPKYWKTVEDHWNEEFKTLEVNINVIAQIRRKGNSTQPLTKEEA